MKLQHHSLILVLLTILPFLSFSQPRDTVIDSHYTWPELQQKFVSYYRDSPENGLTNYQKQTAIQWLHSQLTLVDVVYVGYDNRIHAGQIICHQRVADEVKEIFTELLLLKFPIHQCKPISEFYFSDARSMQANNTNGFDYRLKTGSVTVSRHAYGLAIDINPMQNPYKKRTRILPLQNSEGEATGRIRISEEMGRKVIAVFRKHGWIWGGSWRSLQDYMHFEKH